MASYDAYLSEKNQIDDFMEKGYIMTSSTGTLDGDVVEFQHKTTADKKKVRLTSPDSRKYFATLFIKQQEKITK
ncbi:hypothetical protein [Virgibacillus ihumii]|uniref:hypothetical protein n=1 Tax=Virgibacillus ihumii TaxID=2686091 RepID=UPI00157E2951|nr:hypothetical protein [Virgibacillus ihumii]